jgi:hypothetical protein
VRTSSTRLDQGSPLLLRYCAQTAGWRLEHQYEFTDPDSAASAALITSGGRSPSPAPAGCASTSGPLLKLVYEPVQNVPFFIGPAAYCYLTVGKNYALTFGDLSACFRPKFSLGPASGGRTFPVEAPTVAAKISKMVDKTVGAAQDLAHFTIASDVEHQGSRD